MGLTFAEFRKRASAPRPKAKRDQVLLYADETGITIIDDRGNSSPIATPGGPHNHDEDYAAIDHAHPGGDHPDATAHEQMGLAAADHTHAGGTEHPDLAAHESLGLAAEEHTHDTTHTHDGYATDSELTTHAGTAHGLSEHAIDGAYHSGSEVLPTQGQKNALAGTSGTPGSTNQYVTHKDARLSDARTPTAHTHDYAATDHAHALEDADIPAAIARDAEVTAAIATHATTPHGGSSWEFPVGYTLMSTVDVNPATFLGYGTWAKEAEGRLLLTAGATFNAGSTGGSATHGHSFTQPSNHTIGAVAATAMGAVKIGTSGTTAAAQTHTHAAPSIDAHSGGAVADATQLPPYGAYYIWRRTA